LDGHEPLIPKGIGMSNPSSKPEPTVVLASSHRIRVVLTEAGVMIQNPMPGVQVEVCDYNIPDDWDGPIGIDSYGDKFEYLLFDDKGEIVADAIPPNEDEAELEDDDDWDDDDEDDEDETL